MAEATITVTAAGPYLVRGDVAIIDSKGNRFAHKGDVVALCRCGGSARKPFCDGTHARIGFSDQASAAAAAAISH
ncbi:MAG TPA: CDGSH iron-sulfur domain-containing protein [Dehalococcoidia bacterium]|nr:CDGSH iron-sulfur domain-containing protein [Dehalococcoidia bacterium]